MRLLAATVALLLGACASDGGGAGVDIGGGDTGRTDIAAGCSITEGFALTERVTLDEAPGAGIHAALTVLPDDTVWVAYGDLADGAVRLVSWRDGVASTPATLPDGVHVAAWIGRSMALGHEKDGTLVLAFHHGQDRNLRLARRQPGAWSVEIVDPRSMAGLDVALAVDGDDRIHLAYLAGLEGDLRYAVGRPGTWAIDDVDTEDYVGNDPSIALGADGEVHLAYYHCGHLTGATCDAGELRYAHGRPGAWHIATLDATDDSGWYPALVLDADGAPLVAYQAHATGELRLARPGAENWACETVAPGPGCGAFPSLALVGGVPLVLHQDTAGGRVMLTWRQGAKWEGMELDSEGCGAYAGLQPYGACDAVGIYRAEGAGLRLVTLEPRGVIHREGEP